MVKIALTITASNGQIIITPPPGVELEISQDVDFSMTIGEAVEKYGVNRNTLSQACTNNQIPFELRGKNRFLREADVVAWVNAPRKRGRPGKGQEEAEWGGGDGQAVKNRP